MTYQPRLGSVGERSIKYLALHGRSLLRDLADGIDSEVAGMHSNLNLCVRNGLIMSEIDAKGYTYYWLPAAASADDVQAGLLESVLLGEQQDDDKLPIGDARELSGIAVYVEAGTLTGHEVLPTPGDGGDIPRFAPGAPPPAEHSAAPAVNGAARDEPSGIRVVLTPSDMSPQRAAQLQAAFHGAGAGRVDHMRLEEGRREGRVDRVERAAEKRHFEFGLYSDGRLVIELDETVGTLSRDMTERLWRFIQSIENLPNGQ